MFRIKIAQISAGVRESQGTRWRGGRGTGFIFNLKEGNGGRVVSREPWTLLAYELSFLSGRDVRTALERGRFSLMEPSSSIAGFNLKFGNTSRADDVLALSIPVLDGVMVETLFRDAKPAGQCEGFLLFQQGDFLIGVAVESLEADLAGQTRRLYARLLAAVQGRQLARVWNYVPKINASSPEGMENYRLFCAGRSLAFEAALGESCEHHMPAASAVGGEDGRLAVIFAATSRPPTHFENPEQVPAYEYPPEHGPRSPSFSRATRVESTGRPWIFISGTAAIKGHATVAPDDLAGQIDCTLDNLRLISCECDLGDRLGADGGWERHFKIYLRHADDYQAAARALEGKLLLPGDKVMWLHTDICRAALMIEIEATLVATTA